MSSHLGVHFQSCNFQMKEYVLLQSELPVNRDMVFDKCILCLIEGTNHVPYYYAINLLDAFYLINQCIVRFLF